MASCDDDYSLLATDDHHHNSHHHHHNHHHLHQFAPHHRYATSISNDSVKVSSTGAGGDGGSSENGCVFEVNPYESSEFDSVTVHESDPKNPRVYTDTTTMDKRKEREREREIERDNDNDNDNDNDLCGNSFKKTKPISTAGIIISSGGSDGGGCGGGGGGGGEYRKDREEWSDTAIEWLLEAYTEKYTQLNRGNLRGRDWEEVAVTVSERSENQSKSVEQCKNKVDNLKKRYKLERHRMSSAGVVVSHWPWFKKMEVIVGSSLPSKSCSDHEKIGGGGGGGNGSGSAGRQQKRYSVGSTGSLVQVNNTKSKPVPNVKWQRVVFKISGASLAGNGPHNVDSKVVTLIAREVAMACRLGVQVAIVIGGRNFFCGHTWINETGADRSTTYQIGLMATVMNSVLLQSALEKMGVQTRVQTAFMLPEVGEPYNRQKALRHLEKGRVVIFGGVGGGSGNPFFSTDTTAAIRATDLNARVVLKGTNVSAIYDCNSANNGIAFEHISFREAASRVPTSMDVMALTFCEESDIPVVVFNLLEPGNISRALCGEQIGTYIDRTGMIS